MNKNPNIPTCEKLFSVQTGASDEKQMLHAIFSGLISTLVHDDGEAMFARTNIGKRYNKKHDELGDCTRITFYDRKTNEPLRRFVLRTNLEEFGNTPAEVFMHTWNAYYERDESENTAIIWITNKIIRLFEMLDDTNISVVRFFEKEENNDTKLSKLLLETYDFLNDVIFKPTNEEMKGFGYRRYPVKGTDNEIRFDFTYNNRIVFATVICHSNGGNTLKFGKPKTTLRGITTVPNNLADLQRYAIFRFLEICNKYVEDNK
jgi:hypothetical protein